MVASESFMYRPLSSARPWSRLASLLLAATLARPALADEKTDTLISQLRTSDDFRVRTQAALALGVTRDAVAVKPLCDALSDGHEAVRGASAAALAKLARPDGLPCLRDREGRESDTKVKAQIAKSIKALEAAASAGDKADVPAGARWYVSIGKVTNKTSRSDGDIEEVVRQAIAQKLRGLDGYAVAPRNEQPAAARKVMDGKKLKGFEFQVTVEPMTYDGDKLAITMRVMITSYPGKDIKAAMSPKISQSGVRKNDTTVEDQLVRALLEDAVQKFDKSVASM